jgi:2,3-diaminopropionate biosynthesis protein SbnB
MLIIRHAEVARILNGREANVIEQIRAAYVLHEEGRSALPHSTFLRFPGNPRDRIIGLPAYLGGDDAAAGMKWIASFPGNLRRSVDRASAAIIVNSLETGRPEALIEGSLISAWRTAASAALAASLLAAPEPDGVAMIGCGVINRHVLRFLSVVFPSLTEVTVYDIDRTRAEAFAAGCAAERTASQRVRVAADAVEAMAAHRLVSIATTATEPHMDAAACPPGSVVLHLSLRDLFPAAIVAAQNVVDDAGHVCRERTSLHLAEQLTGHRRFIDAAIGGLLRGTAKVKPAEDRVTVFSPFGLGVLDLALARHVQRAAERDGLGVRVDGFLPAPHTRNGQGDGHGR